MQTAVRRSHRHRACGAPLSTLFRRPLIPLPGRIGTSFRTGTSFRSVGNQTVMDPLRG